MSDDPKQRRDNPRNSDHLFFRPQDKLGGLYPRGIIDRFADATIANDRNKGDVRGIPIAAPALEQRYGSELEAADKRILERLDSWDEKVRHKMWYDYDNDPRFQEWTREQQEQKEMLHIHDIDEWLDSYFMQLQHGLKVFTTMGICLGIYRTVYLWRTIDRNYAKLNGVGLGSILTDELSLSVCQGGAVGVAFGTGTMVGDNVSRLASIWWDDTVYRPRRQWYNVTAACVTGGIFSSCMTSALTLKTFNLAGHALIMSALVSTSTALGTYLGVGVYKPWVEQYPDHYDETKRPWNEKQFFQVADMGTRGRWI